MDSGKVGHEYSGDVAGAWHSDAVLIRDGYGKDRELNREGRA